MKEMIKTFFKSNKNLLIGTGIGFICLIIVGVFIRYTNNRITEEDIVRYNVIEEKVSDINESSGELFEDVYRHCETINGGFKGHYKEYGYFEYYNYVDDIIKTIDNSREDIEEYEEYINTVPLDELEKYHDYMVKHNGALQAEEDYDFVEVSRKCHESKRYMAYTKELLSYLEDGEISSDDFERITDIEFLLYEVSPYSDDIEDNQLQKELGDKYNIDSQELYELIVKSDSLKQRVD